ncbi:YR290-like protein, partial [Mya arenaria]
VSHIIVDEAHCILSWGASQFRPAFLKIGTLRVILPDAKILALTATATEEAQIFIMSNLSMSNVNIITESPDRRNVFLQVEERSPSTGGQNSAEDSVYAVLDKFLQKLKLKKQSFEKTIVYLPLKWCGLVHLRAKIVFDVGCMVAQYHAPQAQKVLFKYSTIEQMKTRIVDELKKPDSSIRLLLATEACGMGVDIPDVRCIVHLTPPNNIESESTFIQQIGRCGRDGRRSESCVYFNKSDIASNKVNLSDHVRKYLSLDSCRRKYILNYFGHSDEVISEQNIDCCDNCSNCAKVY